MYYRTKRIILFHMYISDILACTNTYSRNAQRFVVSIKFITLKNLLIILQFDNVITDIKLFKIICFQLFIYILKKSYNHFSLKK